MDAFIGVERLKALDADIIRTLEKRTHDNAFYSGPLTLNKEDNQRPGGREVALTVNSNSTYNYYDLAKAELWKPSEELQTVSEFDGVHPYAAV